MHHDHDHAYQAPFYRKQGETSTGPDKAISLVGLREMYLFGLASGNFPILIVRSQPPMQLNV
jgi:hypothetical protein